MNHGADHYSTERLVWMGLGMSSAVLELYLT